MILNIDDDKIVYRNKNGPESLDFMTQVCKGEKKKKFLYKIEDAGMMIFIVSF